MKTILYFVMVMGVSFSTMAQSLEVVVRNVKEAKGTVRVGIFKDGKTFLKDAWIGKTVKAEKGEIRVIFENVPAGIYAMSVIHDENENGELDTNIIGIPKEGFGFSNNAMGTFGPPDFEKASVTVGKSNGSLSIEMRYM